MITYKEDVEGHYKIVTTRTYCPDCVAVFDSVTTYFEGHSFVKYGDKHELGQKMHTSYYECEKCRKLVQKTYVCEGPPCIIVLSVPVDFQEE